MSAAAPNISLLLREAQTRRRRENFLNACKFIGILCLALVIFWIAMLHADTNCANETAESFAGFIIALLFFTLLCAFWFILLFWPFLFYFWANVRAARQRTLLSLLQMSIETGKPLQDIVRGYAASCSSRYAARLQRFAAALESGYSLDAAIRENRGLFRYDVAGMIRLGDSPETLRSLENVAQDERDYSAIRTTTIVRVVYLCTLVVHAMNVMCFVFIKIIPEFEKIFQDFDVQMPAMTLAFLLVSKWCVYYWYLALPFFLLLVLAVLAYLILQTNVVIFRPIGFRRMFRNTDAAKFLRVCAIGVRHRFPIPTILERYRWTVPSNYLRRKGTGIQKFVEQGGDWIDAVCRSGFIGRPEASLLKSAERTGNIATVLDQLAQSKERAQIRKDDIFSKLMFIPLIFLLGGIIGTFVVAMFIPLLELITTLSALI